MAYPNRLRGTDTEFTTFYTVLDNDWSHEPFEFDGRSVAYLGDQATGEWWLLGKRGEVARLGDDIEVEQIPGAGTTPDSYGYLNRLAVIGGQLYACGFRRQVYVRDTAGWRRLDEGLREPLSDRGTALEAIDGVAPDCVYAVGWGGQVWKFDGRAWRRCFTPTNVDFHDVRCVDRDKVLVVGQRGTVMFGSDDSWEVIVDDEFDEDLWGVEWFKDQVFVAGYSGIGRLRPDGIAAEDTGLGRPVLGYRLRAKEGLLWSIGNDDILVFDGQHWREVACPDNAA